MLGSIYDNQHVPPKIEHEIPKEVEELYVEEHGVEPSDKHIVIIPKLGKK